MKQQNQSKTATPHEAAAATHPHETPLPTGEGKGVGLICNACRFQSPSGGFCRRFARFIADLPFNTDECNAFASRFFSRKQTDDERR